MESPLSTVKLRCVEKIDDLHELKRWAGERRETPLGVDTETEGFDVGRHKVRLIQLGDMRTGWAVPFELWGGAALELLRDYEGDFVCHNLPFDHRMIRKSGGLELPWHKCHDTLLLAGLDENQSTRALKPLADALVDPRASAGQQSLHDGMQEHGWTWATVPVNYTPYWVYGALDPVLTCHIWHQLHPKVSQICPQAYDLELGTARVICRMMETGLLTDRGYIHEAINRLSDYRDKVRTWLKYAHNVDTPNGGTQVARAFSALGYEINAVTGTGMPRVDKEVLNLIKKTTEGAVKELAEAVYNCRHAERMIGSYLENFLELADSEGIIRCQIWQLGAARTHRMSVTEPALQTLHRDDKVIRGSFIPRPGHVFISADFSQIEMRLAAALSEDEGLIQAFKDADSGGLDFYSGVASEIYGEFVPKDDRRRQDVKTLSYAKLYGAGVPTMMKSIGLPRDQVQTIHDAFNSRYPGLERLMRETASAAWEQTYHGGKPVVTLGSGRRLPVEKEHASVNYLIQGTAAEVLKRAGLALEAAGLGPGMRLYIHDETLFEVPAEYAEDAKKLIEEVMPDNSYLVPIPVEAKIMPERWAK